MSSKKGEMPKNYRVCDIEGLRAGRPLCSRYPNAYIAWMQSIDAGDVRSER